MLNRFRFVALAVASAHGVADRWRRQYRDDDGHWGTTSSGSSRDIHEKLVALGATPDIDAVAGIIGNKGWSYLRCDVCFDHVVTAVQFTKQYEDGPLICETCLSEAAQVLARAAQPDGSGDA